LRGAFEGLGVAGKAPAAGLALVFVGDFVEDRDQGTGAELVGYGGYLAEPAGLTEGADEAAGLFFGGAEGAPLGDHDRPGEDAADEQDSEDGERHGAAVVEHLTEGAGVSAGGWGSEVGGGGVLQEDGERENSHNRQVQCNCGVRRRGKPGGYPMWCAGC